MASLFDQETESHRRLRAEGWTRSHARPDYWWSPLAEARQRMLLEAEALAELDAQERKDGGQ